MQGSSRRLVNLGQCAAQDNGPRPRGRSTRGGGGSAGVGRFRGCRLTSIIVRLLGVGLREKRVEGHGLRAQTGH